MKEDKSQDNIILIGFMGSGKSTLGKWISRNIHMDFLDTDEYIEAKQNCSINEIFKTQGEAAFRDMETQVLRDLIQNVHHTVISVGGGLPVRQENQELLKQLGTTYYLQTSVEELVRRLIGDTTRPLLSGGDIRSKIENLMTTRESLYKEAADQIISTDGKTFYEIYGIMCR